MKQQTKCPPKCPSNQMDGIGACKCKPEYVNKGTKKKPVGKTCPPDMVKDSSTKCRCAKCGQTFKNGKCVPCPKGHASYGFACSKCSKNMIPKADKCYCETCPIGTYTLLSGSAKCIKCKKGEYVTKKSTCDKCKPGFRVLNGECVRCDQNKVNSGGDMAFCIPCWDKKASADGSKCI